MGWYYSKCSLTLLTNHQPHSEKLSSHWLSSKWATQVNTHTSDRKLNCLRERGPSEYLKGICLFTAGHVARRML